MTRRTIILNVAIAAILLILLGGAVLVWALDLGAVGTALSLGIAAAKALLIALVFMELLESRPSTRLFAAAGLYWLAILMVLTLADVLART